ncbi:hypothetical protein Q4Q35_03670 [Flavivirga aquimarina]|uniref:Uncharacterized protein n=1 Tax=Flavivirga aquimarina TaxID=2027862 RepID=A0ABT8W722_9FLAO|nr:hypothetical protein [Flavivirga aquimarina]MDO5968896.1 hypothetical protein [Flavivirga aquimarina]
MLNIKAENHVKIKHQSSICLLTISVFFTFSCSIENKFENYKSFENIFNLVEQTNQTNKLEDNHISTNGDSNVIKINQALNSWTDDRT